MKVYTLTRFKEGGSKFSSATCIFNSIRVGFPTAEHIVYDNASQHADWQIDVQLNKEIGHWKFIERTINAEDGPICFVDPDVIFYGNVEDKLSNIKQVVAGRYCPKYWNPVEEGNEIDRIHTSLLYISDPVKLRKLIKIETCENYSVSPYQGFFCFSSGKKFIYDTFANICHMIGAENIYQFKPDILDLYTHLISGSMLDRVSAKLVGGSRLKDIHKLAETSPTLLRGFWRENDQFYRENPAR
jgi:hypothetical protein